MKDWVCPQDRLPLEARAGALVSAGCAHRYESSGDVPIFTGCGAGLDVGRRAGLLDDLWQEMERGSSERAAREFCAAHGCARGPAGSSWRHLFAAAPVAKILEIGAGFGDDSLCLAGHPAGLILLVPTRTNALILDRRLQQHGPVTWTIAVADGAERLPLADRSVGAIVLEEAAAASFDISEQSFPRIAAEWRRVMVPSGTVCIGLDNALHRLPGMRLLQSRIARPRPESLNRLVKRASAVRRGSALRARTAVRELTRQGFRPPAVWAPLPSERRVDAVIPTADARAVRYFLDHLIRRSSPAVERAARLARFAVRLDLFRRLVPYYYLVFELGP